MKRSGLRLIALSLVFTMILSFFVPSISMAASDKRSPMVNGTDQPLYVADEVIVKFKSSISKVEQQALKEKAGLSTKKKSSLTGSEVAKVKKGVSLEQALRQLKKDPRVLYAQPNYIYRMQATVNDPDYNLLWGLKNNGQNIMGWPGDPGVDIDIEAAWDYTMGSTDVIVAVIDTGVYINHPDLRDNIWVNTGEIPGDGIDNDGNGYIDDIYGWNFWANNNSVYDFLDGDEHGTHVAGTIAAAANNSIGITGVASNVRIMPLKFIGADGTGYTSDAIEAIEYAAMMGAHIVNCSWGAPSDNYVDMALLDAISSTDMFFVAAAGNFGYNNDVAPMTPANLPSDQVISVGALNNRGFLADFSNYGASSVDLAAPGEGIWSLRPTYHSGLGAAVQASGTVADYTYKVIHLGFGVEDINDGEDRAAIMQQLLNYLETDATTPIMLVDDDNSEANPEYEDFRSSYLLALSGYNIVEEVVAGDLADGPTAAEMAGHTVIWFTGDAWGYFDEYGNGTATLTENDLTNLKEFLNGGGRLLLIGEDVAYLNEADPLFIQYLQAVVISDVGEFTAVKGVGGYTGEYYLDSWWAHYRDVLIPTGNSEVIFEYIDITSPYTFMSGTSMAAPHVAGVAALMLSINPELSPQQLKGILNQTVRPMESLDGITVSGGMLNAYHAVVVAKVPDVPVGLSVKPGDRSAKLNWQPVLDIDLAGYNIYRDNVKINALPVTDTVYIESGLDNDVTYYYQVTAVDNYGLESPPSSSVGVTPYFALVYPEVTVPGKIAAKNGSTLVFDGAVTEGATLDSALLEQLDAGGNPLEGADILLSEELSIEDGEISGSYTVAAFHADAEAVRLKVVIDMEGDKYSGNSLKLKVDNVPPTVSLSYSKPSPVSTGLLTITATFSEDILGTPTITIDQAGFADTINSAMVMSTGDPKVWKYNYLVGAHTGFEYIDGEALVTINALDGAGNPNETTVNNIFIIDTIPPHRPTIESVDDKLSPAVSANASPPMVISSVEAGDIIIVYSNAGQLAAQVADDDTIIINLTGLAEGPHFLTAKAVDLAGNISAVSNGFNYTVLSNGGDGSDDGDGPGDGGGGGTGGGVTPSSEPTQVQQSYTPGQSSSLKLGEEAVLLASSSAFREPVTLFMKKADMGDVANDTHLLLRSSIFDIYTKDGQQPTGTVELTLKYYQDTVDNPWKTAIYYYNDSTGQWEYIGGKVDTDTGTVTAELSHFSKYAVLESNKTFSDITKHWAKEDIEILAARQIAAGMDETRFAPDAPITRAQFVALLVKALELKPQTVNSFGDVMEGDWYAGVIGAAVEAGIVKGYADGTFRPNAKITREEVAVMTVQALKVNGFNVDSLSQSMTEKNIIFVDAGRISLWAQEPVRNAAEMGMIKGYNDGTFGPGKNTTRAEAAVLLKQLIFKADLI